MTAPACAELEAGPSRTVTRIIDGETLALDDGTELRLIGMLAPRAIDVGTVPGTWRMELAAVEALQALVLGRTIEIRFAGERSDRYGRLKGHAFLAVRGWHRSGCRAACSRWAWRAPMRWRVHRACEAELLAAERTAREARLGVWAEAAYAVRSADAPAALLRHAATFQLVEGRVMHVATTRGSIYLNFGQSRRRGFSVSLRLGDRARLGSVPGQSERSRAGRRCACAAGSRSGQVEPFIDLTAAGNIEVIAEATVGRKNLTTAGRRAERRSRAK